MLISLRHVLNYDILRHINFVVLDMLSLQYPILQWFQLLKSIHFQALNLLVKPLLDVFSCSKHEVLKHLNGVLLFFLVLLIAIWSFLRTWKHAAQFILVFLEELRVVFNGTYSYRNAIEFVFKVFLFWLSLLFFGKIWLYLLSNMPYQRLMLLHPTF